MQLLITKNSRYLNIDSLEYDQILSKIHKIKSSDNKIYGESDLIIFCQKSEFYIEATTAIKDASNRPGKILVYGKLPNLYFDYYSSDFSFEISQKLTIFSQKFNRELTNKQIDLIDKTLMDISSQYEKKKNLWYLAKILSIIALPFILFGILDGLLKNINWITIISIISINNLFWPTIKQTLISECIAILPDSMKNMICPFIL